MGHHGDIEVGIGQIKVCRGSGMIVARAIGSCIAVAIYDEKKSVGGLAHVLLAEGKKEDIGKPAMYAGPGVKRLKRKVMELGGLEKNLHAKMAGGSQMFSSPGTENIGDKNAKAVEVALKKHGIKLVGSNTGGFKARTVRFRVGSNTMVIEIKI